MQKIRIGTRKSNLAIAQASIVANMLIKANSELEVELVKISTLGDKNALHGRLKQDMKIAFTKELEVALINGEIDAAVHSLKDLPSALQDGLIVASYPPRDDPRDVLVSKNKVSLNMLPANARIGTSSIRRRVQLLQLRPDLQVVELHGNVDTRVNKMQSLGLDGIVLAAAGLNRLGMQEVISQVFDVGEMIPAAGQGILAVETNEKNSFLEQLRSIDDSKSRTEALCERSFTAALGAGCNLPVAVNAKSYGAKLEIQAMIASQDGSKVIKARDSGSTSDPEGLGKKLAIDMLNRGAEFYLKEVAELEYKGDTGKIK
ncbi:MAG: hydroxymethylbilane synthase [Conexivisphaerales archaeon]